MSQLFLQLLAEDNTWKPKYQYAMGSSFLFVKIEKQDIIFGDALKNKIFNGFKPGIYNLKYILYLFSFQFEIKDCSSKITIQRCTIICTDWE